MFTWENPELLTDVENGIQNFCVIKIRFVREKKKKLIDIGVAMVFKG